MCASPARKLHNFHLQSPTPASQYRTTSVPAHPAGTPTQPSPRATIIAGNVAQGCRTALTGNGKRHKRRLRVPGGTRGLREGAKTSPKGVGRYSQATERDINVAQGCRTVLATERDINVAQGYRAALTGYEKGRKRRPRVPGGTHGQREGA